uniref:Uncharacterized protein n=1 Tax=Marseillevirus LCMAC101 TaxID=2506602 RepID=A0A481YSC6_9VIRU|nr:MAG: hypothetical protein LCMAC101_02400 [Marseillevirus LCMAC101]
MCLKCHESLSDENVACQIKDALKNPDFENWNTNSCFFTLIAYSGVNGSEVQDLAGQLLENLIKWKEDNDPPANSFRTHGDCTIFEAFPCIDDIEKRYLNMKNDPHLKIQPSEVTQRREAVFHGDFLNKYDPESEYGRCSTSEQN